MSTTLNNAKYSEAKYSTKVLLKLKCEDVKLQFSQLGYWKDLHLELYVDAVLGNVEKDDKVKSMMGYFIALCDKDGNFSPIHWKSKVIDRVAQDAKTAETLALEAALDDAIFITKTISEIYTGNPDENNIPIVVNDDSKSLIESLLSTKKVKRKTMRLVISSLKQSISDGIISNVIHFSTKNQLADIFTKKGVNSEKLLECLDRGNLSSYKT